MSKFLFAWIFLLCLAFQPAFSYREISDVQVSVQEPFLPYPPNTLRAMILSSASGHGITINPGAPMIRFRLFISFNQDSGMYYGYSRAEDGYMNNQFSQIFDNDQIYCVPELSELQKGISNFIETTVALYMQQQ